MNGRATEQAVVALAVAYLVVLALAVANLSYDVWGALVLAPVLLMAGVAVLRRMFRGSQAQLFDVMVVGMVAKLAGGVARYWVSFEAYGGATDAQRYHQYGAKAASDLWAGRSSWTAMVPHGTGSAFIERFTGLVYTLSGSSRLGGFFVFAWIGYLGIALFVKAAVIAIPGLARRRYALIVVLAPSVIFWPSSIGKEAYMFLMLGLATFGIARLLSRRGFVVSAAITVAGLGGAAFVRPHIVGVWIAGMLPALVVALLVGRGHSTRRSRSRAGDVLVLTALITVALAGLSVIAQSTVNYLNPSSDEVSVTSISDILTETTRRTSKESGSTFVPPAVASPTDWPYASLRTLTRPLIFEADSLSQLLVAAEMMAFLGLCLVSWRRLVNLPRLIITNPFVTFAMTTLFLAGLAYSSFGNLGVLTRQKSLIFPLMLLIPCLPKRSTVTRRLPPNQNSSTSPRESDQLASGGMPASLTARHVSTGPPPGNGIDPDDIWA